MGSRILIVLLSRGDWGSTKLKTPSVLAPARAGAFCFSCGAAHIRVAGFPKVQSRHCRVMASLPPASRSVVAARPPNGQLGGKLGLDIHSPVGASSFPQAKARYAERGPKKASAGRTCFVVLGQ